MLLRSIVFLVLLAWSADAFAAREPTGQWIVHFDDAQCVAERAYGSPDDPVRLVLKAPPLGEVMQVAVMRNRNQSDAKQIEASIGIDDRPEIRTNILTFTPDKQKLRVYLLNMPVSDFALVRQANSLAIRAAGLNETFALSKMAPLLKIMDQCVADLQQVWNVAPTGSESSLAQRARANIAKLFDSDDYPAVAMSKNQSGRVRFAVLVNEAGRVADCTIIETSGVASLDTQTCGIVMTKAEFEPALGQDGKPAKDAAIQSVRWMLPD